jgi:hypothetical protein
VRFRNGNQQEKIERDPLERDRDGSIVHDANPGVARADADLTLVIHLAELEANRDERKDGLDDAVLEYAPLEGEVAVWV